MINIKSKKLILSICSSALFGFATITSADNVKKSWLFAGQNLSNTHADAKSKITSENASKLQVKWEYDTKGDVSATPTSDGENVYIVDWGGWIHAVNASTGVALWSKNLGTITGLPGSIFSRTSPAIVDDKLVLGIQGTTATVIVLDKKDGHLLWKKNLDSHVASLITQSPIVYDGKIFIGVSSSEEALATIPNYACCSFRGSMVSLDLKSGKILWQTYIVPPGYSGGAIWGSTPAIDPKRKALYLTTGNNYSIPDKTAECVAGAADEQAAQACVDPKNYIDSIMSLNMDTGRVNWSYASVITDTWTVSCLLDLPSCPENSGPDADFGQGPSLYTTKVNGKMTDLIGAGQKSGIYWALNRDTGKLVWNTQVGPGGTTGGLQWGSAVSDGVVYTALANSENIPFALPNSSMSSGGGFAALDGATGKKIWQIEDPVNGKKLVYAPVTVVNDVMLGCSMDATGPMYAINTKTGKILWTFNSGASCNSGASIIDDTIYWGSGYANFGFGVGGVNKVFAFTIPKK